MAEDTFPNSSAFKVTYFPQRAQPRLRIYRKVEEGEDAALGVNISDKLVTTGIDLARQAGSSVFPEVLARAGHTVVGIAQRVGSRTLGRVLRTENVGAEVVRRVITGEGFPDVEEVLIEGQLVAIEEVLAAAGIGSVGDIFTTVGLPEPDVFINDVLGAVGLATPRTNKALSELIQQAGLPGFTKTGARIPRL